MSNAGDDGTVDKIRLAELAGKQRTLVTEDSAALAFAEQYRGQLLFDHDGGAWFRWTGNHWRQERTRLAFDWARELICTSNRERSHPGEGNRTQNQFHEWRGKICASRPPLRNNFG